MLSGNEKIESGVLRLNARWIGRTKSVEVGLQFTHEILRCPEREKTFELRHRRMPAYDAQRNVNFRNGGQLDTRPAQFVIRPSGSSV